MENTGSHPKKIERYFTVFMLSIVKQYSEKKQM